MSFTSSLFPEPDQNEEEEEEQAQEEGREERIQIPEAAKTKQKRSKTSQHIHKKTKSILPRSPERSFMFPNASLDSTENASISTDDIIPTSEFTPYDPDETNWSDVSEEEHESDDDTYCALCENAQNEEQEEANPTIHEIHTHVENNYFEVDRVRLAKQTQQLYDRKMRRFTKTKQFWPQRKILEHFEQHAFNPAIIRGSELRTLNHALQVMKSNSLFRKDTAGRSSVDSKEMKLYLEIMKSRNSLMDTILTSKKSKSS